MSKFSAYLKSRLRHRRYKSFPELQRYLFEELLKYVFANSPFYKELYNAQGINESHIPEISLRDLPFVDKTIIMDNLDQVFTSDELKRGELETWLGQNQDPKALYKDQYFVLHTSGSSNKLGIFAYEKKYFNMGSAIGGLQFVNGGRFSFRQKTLFYAATHGHFALANFARCKIAAGYPISLAG